MAEAAYATLADVLYMFGGVASSGGLEGSSSSEEDEEDKCGGADGDGDGDVMSGPFLRGIIQLHVGVDPSSSGGKGLMASFHCARSGMPVAMAGACAVGDEKRKAVYVIGGRNQSR